MTALTMPDLMASRISDESPGAGRTAPVWRRGGAARRAAA
jgi:hypothetical protein